MNVKEINKRKKEIMAHVEAGYVEEAIDSCIELIEELFASAPIEKRCSNLRKDNISPYCGRDLAENSYVTESRRLVCSTASLQLWCLDNERCDKCIYYNGEPFIEPELN